MGALGGGPGGLKRPLAVGGPAGLADFEGNLKGGQAKKPSRLSLPFTCHLLALTLVQVREGGGEVVPEV